VVICVEIVRRLRWILPVESTDWLLIEEERSRKFLETLSIGIGWFCFWKKEFQFKIH
jgi:hypothetical protein